VAWREWGVSMARARFPVNSSSPNSRGIWQAGVAERMVKKPAKRGPKPQSNPSPPSEPARSPAESVNEQTNSGVGHAQSFQIVRSWKKRLGSLAQPDPTHPLAMALDRLTPFCPSLIYHGDTQGFLQRVDHNWSLLASTVRDSEGHVDRLMAILWWYWATMSALRHAEAMGLTFVDLPLNVRTPGALERPPFVWTDSSVRQRVRAHRDRRRGTIREASLFQFHGPPFTGTMIVRPNPDVQIEVSAPALRKMPLPPPSRKARGNRPTNSRAEALVPMVAAHLLVNLKGAATRRKLGWTRALQLLSAFTPPSGRQLFNRVVAQESLRRQVRRHRSRRYFTRMATALKKSILPAIEKKTALS